MLKGSVVAVTSVLEGWCDFLKIFEKKIKKMHANPQKYFSTFQNFYFNLLRSSKGQFFLRE